MPMGISMCSTFDTCKTNPCLTKHSSEEMLTHPVYM